MVLAIIGLLNSAVSLYYYARIVRTMFLDKPNNSERIVVPRTYNFLLGFLMLAVVVFGIYFEGLRRIASSAVVMFGHI